MSVSGTTTTVSYTGDGSTTSFSVTFPFKGSGSGSEITVVERNISTGAETAKIYTTDYTVTGGDGATGTVIAGTAPASTVEWHIRRNTTATQTTDYVTNDPFAADTIEGDFDRLAMSGQERDSDIGQAFKFPDTYTGGASVRMPEPVAGAYLVFNDAADALETSDDTTASEASAAAAATSATAAAASATTAATSATTAAAAAATALAAKITISTSAPSGGSAGDIWYRVTV